MASLKKPTVKNPALVEAMAELKKNQTPATEQAMIEAFKEAKLIAPISLRTPLEEVEPNEKGERQMEASLLAITNNAGDRYFPAFTEWLEYLKWKNDPDVDTMVITYEQYVDLLVRNNIDVKGVLVNPGDANILFSKEKLSEISGIPIAAPKAQNAANGEQKIEPLFGTQTITNPEVIMAAGRLRDERTADAQRALFEKMRSARFVAPVLMEDMPNAAPGTRVNAKAEFIMINHGDERYLPLFTSLSELQKWTGAPKCKAVPLTMVNYSQMLNDPKNTAAGIVIDPFTIGLAFTKEQALGIQPRFTLRPDAEPNEEMLDALRALFAQESTVKAAYYNGILANGTTEGNLIVLDTTMEESAVRAFADQVSEICRQYGNCAVAPNTSDLGKAAIADKEPFYVAE